MKFDEVVDKKKRSAVENDMEINTYQASFILDHLPRDLLCWSYTQKREICCLTNYR